MPIETTLPDDFPGSGVQDTDAAAAETPPAPKSRRRASPRRTSARSKTAASAEAQENPAATPPDALPDALADTPAPATDAPKARRRPRKSAKAPDESAETPPETAADQDNSAGDLPVEEARRPAVRTGRTARTARTGTTRRTRKSAAAVPETSPVQPAESGKPGEPDQEMEAQPKLQPEQGLLLDLAPSPEAVASPAAKEPPVNGADGLSAMPSASPAAEETVPAIDEKPRKPRSRRTSRTSRTSRASRSSGASEAGASEAAVLEEPAGESEPAANAVSEALTGDAASETLTGNTGNEALAGAETPTDEKELAGAGEQAGEEQPAGENDLAGDEPAPARESAPPADALPDLFVASAAPSSAAEAPEPADFAGITDRADPSAPSRGDPVPHAGEPDSAPAAPRDALLFDSAHDASDALEDADRDGARWDAVDTPDTPDLDAPDRRDFSFEEAEARKDEPEESGSGESASDGLSPAEADQEAKSGRRRRRSSRRKSKNAAPDETESAPESTLEAGPQFEPEAEADVEPKFGPEAAPEEEVADELARKRGRVKDKAETEAPRLLPPRGLMKMLISVLPGDEVEVVLTENGRVCEYYVEMMHHAKIRGNIYKGVISNVDANLQAAFVNYGVPKNGFLQIDEVHPEYYLQHHDSSRGSRFPPIQKALRPGQEVMVQVVKEPTGNKGAFLTTWISLAGRFLVLTPGQEEIGVSRKVEDGAERNRLRELVRGLEPGEGMGAIVRTVSAGLGKPALQRDLTYLKRLWKDIVLRGGSEKAPALIYREPDLAIRAVRDYLSDDISEVWVDDAGTVEMVREMAGILFPNKPDLVRFYENRRESLWEHFGIREQLEQIHSREVEMPSGGRLVFDQTEALMAIDINSGRISGRTNFEATAFRTNMEAARTIAEQLRLRDIGGQIVIDFIEMRDPEHCREVEKTLRAAMRWDRARHDIGRMSNFGLLQIVRQRMASSAISLTLEPCPCCQGTGVRRSLEWQAIQTLRDLRRAMHDSQEAGQSHCVASIQADLAIYLLNHKREALVRLEKDFAIPLEIRINGLPAGLLDSPAAPASSAGTSSCSSACSSGGSSGGAGNGAEPVKPAASRGAGKARSARVRRRRRGKKSQDASADIGAAVTEGDEQ